MHVSVIIPAFNSAAFLGPCLRSLSSQRGVAEIIVIDDASTDQTAKLVLDWKDSKVVLVRNRTNMGASRARHRGVQISTAEFLLFLDSDDFLSPGSVETALSSLHRDHCDISLFNLVKVDADGVTKIYNLAPPVEPIDGRAAFALTLGRWRIHTQGVIRRKVYQDAIAAFTSHGFSDDELLSRMILLNAPLVGGNDGSYFYRRVEKPVGFDQVLNQTRTNVAVARLAAEAGFSAREAAPARALAARSLLGLAYRARHHLGRAGEVRSLLEDVRSQPFSLQMDDLMARFYQFAAVLIMPTR